MLARYFEFDRYGTTLTTEIRAGVTTFLTMAYIIVVNPAILAAAGIPRGPSTVATIIAAVIGTLLMGLYAKRPIAIAPYMGENAFIAFTVCSPALLGASWQTALGAVFIGGVLFVIITALRLRGWLAEAVPRNLKYAFVVGIGLFLTFIGLVDTHIVSLPGVLNVLNIPDMPEGVKIGILQGSFFGDAPPPPVQMGSLLNPSVLLSLLCLLSMIGLMILNVRGAILISIIGITALSLLLKAFGLEIPGVALPDRVFSNWADIKGIKEIAFQLDVLGALKVSFIPVLLTVFLMDFVDTMGTLIGVSARAGFLDENGNLPDIHKPMMADAIATVTGALAGTTTTGSYIESAAGIEEGGRTGLTAVVTAALFALALLFTPLLTIVPQCAYGPALIVVGILMIGAVKEIDFADMTELFPAFMTIVLMIFTYNLGIGITAGFVFYPITKLIGGRIKEVKSGAWVLFGISAIFYVLYAFTFQ